MEWTKIENHLYVIEVSDTTESTTCPKCPTLLPELKLINIKRDNEGELQYEKYRCPGCGTILKIFND